VGIKGEDLDRVAVGDPRFLQGRRGVIRGEFIRERGAYELPICHRRYLL
jgi:hypothetical protein